MRTRYRVNEQDQAHFVTSTVVTWLPLFTTAVRCDILVNSLAYCRCKKALKIYAWVILDNHKQRELEAALAAERAMTFAAAASEPRHQRHHMAAKTRILGLGEIGPTSGCGMQGFFRLRHGGLEAVGQCGEGEQGETEREADFHAGGRWEWRGFTGELRETGKARGAGRFLP